MQTTNVAFTGITAGSIKKGMILERNTGLQQGLKREILGVDRCAGGQRWINFRYLIEGQDTQTVYPLLVNKNVFFQEWDLVGWAKKLVKGKK